MRLVSRASGLAVSLVAMALLLPLAAHAQGAADKEQFKNLKVLPKDISEADLDNVMNGFTRALGVRCIFCHVGTEGKPLRHEDFQLDDKMTKVKARAMMLMAHDINEVYLAKLQSRATPAVHVECATCHHGATLPRSLQDVLLATYDGAGVDSTLLQYQGLRDKYYGRAVYDFGEAPLADVSQKLQGEGHADDALKFAELNVKQNPNSGFAKRQHAAVALDVAFAGGDPVAGTKAYHDFKDRYSDKVVNENMLINLGYGFLREGKADKAIVVFQVATRENPTSSNAFDSLGEAYLAHGDKKLAREAYKKSLVLDPKNDNAQAKLDEIAGKKKH